MDGKSEDTPKHWWLVAGIIVSENVKTGETYEKTMNLVRQTAQQRFLALDLGRAQQGLQVRYMHGMPQEAQAGVKIVDVPIVSVSYLGHMTVAEFNAGFAAASGQETPNTELN